MQVALGEERRLAVSMKLEGVSEVIEVVVDAGEIISAASNGPASNVSGEAIQKLPTVARGIEDFARLSPYFNSSGSGDGSGAEIFVMNANGANPVNISRAIGNDTEPVWSPNGNKIAFRALRNGGMDIYLMNPDGSEQLNITPNTTTSSGVSI